MADDVSSTVRITRHSPTPANLEGNHETMIEQAERYLQTVGVRPDDETWQQRRALILQKLGRR